MEAVRYAHSPTQRWRPRRRGWTTLTTHRDTYGTCQEEEPDATSASAGVGHGLRPDQVRRTQVTW